MVSRAIAAGVAATPARVVAPRMGSMVWTATAVVVGVVAGGRATPAGLLALAVAAGLPHGAFDYDVARRKLAGGAKRWWLPFLGIYLGLVAVTLLAWWLMPAATLAIFFLLSTVHFGLVDASVRPWRPWQVAAHGGVAIVVPAVLHPTEFVRIVDILIGPDAVVVHRLLAGPMAFLWFVAVLATLIGYLRRGRAMRMHAALDLTLVAGLFAAAPPLVAFSTYFALIHTPRAFADMAGPVAGGDAAIGQAALFTALALMLAGVIFVVWPRAAIDHCVIRTSFMLLSALTVPHMWLEFVSGRAAAIPRRPVPPAANAPIPASA